MFSSQDAVTFLLLSTSLFLAGLAVIRQLATPSPSPRLQLKQDLNGVDNGALSNLFDAWWVKQLRTAGFTGSTSSVLLMNSLGGLALGFGLWVLEFNELICALSSLTTILLGLVGVLVLSKRRMRQFSDHFPSALELIARSVKAGESFEDAIRLSSQHAQEPVKRELEICVHQFNLGLSVGSVMQKLANRMPTMDVRIFAHTISIHRESGGQLSKAVDRLATVIRQRMDYMQKIRTMTALGRFAAIAIGYMGIGGLAYLCLVHPDYIQKLWASPLGQKLAIYAAISELVGIIWVAITLSNND